MPDPSIGDWFNLRDGRSSFEIHPRTDRALYFERKNLYDKIQREIRKAFLEKKAPKLVIWGDWGIGKTHTLSHIQYFLENNADKYPCKIIFLELNDIEKKTRFDLLHHQILDAISMEYIAEELLSKLQSKHQKKIKDCLRLYLESSDLVNAFSSLLGAGQNQQLGWSWLNGQGLTQNERGMLPVTGDLTNSKDFVDILRFIGDVHRELEGKVLLVLIDEVEKLERVKDDDAIDHWTQALKDLASPGNESVGIILAASLRSQEDLDKLSPLSDDQVRSRFGYDDGDVEMPNFQSNDTEAFLKDVLSKIVDHDKLKTQTGSLKSRYSTQFDEDVYPFTKEAFDTFVEYVSRDPAQAVPRAIMKRLDDLAFEAFEAQNPLIDGELLEKMDYD
jgi:Cdc6-like AAA superfamily ATPase